MANMKNLAKDTAIYGVSSIVGRFLNYLLVPLYTAAFTAASGGYGVVTNLYAYTALILVILTFGMETTFFRFANKEDENPGRVFSTSLIFIGGLSLLFVVLVCAFIGPISLWMGYPDHPSWIVAMAVTVALDSFQAILFAFLRYQRRAIKFASLKLGFIFLNIGLNLLYFIVFPRITASGASLPSWLYNPETGVGYVFYINVACTCFMTIFFVREIAGLRNGWDSALMKRMLSYSWPILVLGIAGILNQTADKILFPKVYHAPDATVQLGIYGAAAKIAMIMAMITQAFRYAYEPMVFASAAEKDAKQTYADGMKYFVIFTLLAFLAVMAYLDILKYLLRNPDYWVGLKVVPIVMAAEILMGIYFNLSFWYKLIDKTIWGAVFSIAGCTVLVLANIIFVPKFSYTACAWAGVAGYGTAMVLSYVVGQRKNRIDYPLLDMAKYLILTVVLFLGIQFSREHLSFWPSILVNTALLCLFMAYIVRKDLPLGSLPGIGKYFRK